jgi:hypothetical protein
MLKYIIGKNGGHLNWHAFTGFGDTVINRTKNQSLEKQLL